MWYNNNMLKEHIKTHCSSLYNIGRAVRDATRNSKSLKETAKLYNASHDADLEADSLLAIIYVNDGPKRLNLIFKSFDKNVLATQDVAEFLTMGINFSKKENYSLRIISRNNLINPKDYIDFVKEHNLDAPKEYSFYTDSGRRVSGKAHRLSITKNDFFFTEQDLEKFKGWIKNGKH